jgi:hypothetical protein
MNRKMLFEKLALANQVTVAKCSVRKMFYAARIHRLIKRQPRMIYLMMMITITASAVLFFKQHQINGQMPPPPIVLKETAYFPSGVQKIICTGVAVREIWNIQTELESLLQKGSLSSGDTIVFRRLRQRLSIINPKNRIKP